MNDHEYAIYEALNGAHEFGGTYAASFPETSNALRDFARIPALLGEIAPGDSRPGLAASPATGKKQSLIDEVRSDLIAIAKTARTIADQDPGFDTTFKVGDISHRSTVETARHFLRELTRPGVAAKFIAYDLPPDFVAHLEQDLAAITETSEDQKEDKREAAGENEKLRSLIREGKELLFRLNTSVRNRFRNQPAILAEWQTASHVRRQRRKTDDHPAPVLVAAT